MEPVFVDFIESIKLSKRQRKDAILKYKGVCESLHAKYYPDLEYSGKTKLLVGSYGKKTNIRPPGDIDVIFKMPDALFDGYDEKENGQSVLLQDVRKVLMPIYSTTERISAFGKVVVVHFAEGSHKVEVLPAWQKSDGTFVIPDTSEGGTWEKWNPVADIDAIKESNSETGKTKSLIRLLKKWRQECSVPLKAFKIEFLVIKHLKEHYNNDVIDVEYIDLLQSFVEYLMSQADTSLTLPSGSNVLIGSDWYSKAESALGRIKKAKEAYVNKKLDECTEELRKVFGQNFPKIEIRKEYLSDSKLKSLFELYPSDEDQFIDKDFGYPLNINRNYSVVIDTRIDSADGFRRGFLLDGLMGSLFFRLPKQASLSFYIKHIDVPEPFKVFWKVRNFGDEAMQKNVLRGKIFPDEGNRERVESTAYTGVHFVECYIIKNGQCVATGSIPVPIGI